MSNNENPAKRCTSPSECSQDFGRAFMDVSIARDACVDVIHWWTNFDPSPLFPQESWAKVLSRIGNAIQSLEDARAKIKSHIANDQAQPPRAGTELKETKPSRRAGSAGATC